MKDYFVYILTNQARGTLYIGMTGTLERRYEQHAANVIKSFSQKYDLHKLVYYEQTESAEVAIAREKQLKNWHRQWKINLIESVNPDWTDLSHLLGMDAETSSA